MNEEEYGPEQARSLLGLIDSPGSLEEYEYEGNVYILRFDFSSGSVVLLDDLDPGEHGRMTLSIAELRSLLAEQARSAEEL